MSDEQPTVVDVIARSLGYDPPSDGLIGSGFSRMLAYQRAADACRALGLPLDVSAAALEAAVRAVAAQDVAPVADQAPDLPSTSNHPPKAGTTP